MASIQDLKNLYFIWMEYVMFHRKPNDGVKELLNNIYQTRRILIEKQMLKEQINTQDFYKLLQEYMYHQDINLEDRITAFISSEIYFNYENKKSKLK